MNDVATAAASTVNERLAGLLADLRAIYPGSAVTIDASPAATAAPAARRFRVLPSARSPRLAVPADVPAVARAALRRTTAADSALAVASRAVIGTTASSALRRAFRTEVAVADVTDGSVERLLAAETGDELRFSVQIGKPRANAKPVLGVYAATGAEIGFCKVGVAGALSEKLVAHETAALRHVRATRPATFRVPGVLHAGRWSGGTLLLMTPEHGHRSPGRTAPAVPVHVICEIAELSGIEDLPLADTAWASGALMNARDVDAATASDELTALMERLLGSHGGAQVPVGAWHGDFGPWNMAWHGPPVPPGAAPRALVWDWERLTDGVPAGLDAAHFTAHDALRAIGDWVGAGDALGSRAEPAVAEVLRAWAPAPLAERLAPAIVDCYLMSIALRFGGDAARAGTRPVARLATWYAALLRARLGATTWGAEVVA